MSEELKPCPFCGGAATEEWTGTAEFYGHEHQSVSIECGKCGVGLSIDTSCGKDGKPSRGYEFACSCCNDLGIVARDRWNRRAQPAEAEGVSNTRLMNTLAELARRAPLRTLQTICETQHQVSTVKLERYLGPVGDTLAGYAFTLRNDFDKLSATLSAVTAERDRLREQVKSLQSDANSWQSGYDKGRNDGTKHRKIEIDQLRAEVQALLALLGKSLPVVKAHAGASHMLEGFRPTRNKWDELVDGIRAAIEAAGVTVRG